jgi:hypothetical protein
MSVVAEIGHKISETECAGGGRDTPFKVPYLIAGSQIERLMVIEICRTDESSVFLTLL